MKTYQILYAEDVPHYAIGEIKARGPKDALAKARKVDTDTFTALDPDWSNPVCRRIVHITEERSGKYIAEDVRLGATDGGGPHRVARPPPGPTEAASPRTAGPP